MRRFMPSMVAAPVRRVAPIMMSRRSASHQQSKPFSARQLTELLEKRDGIREAVKFYDTEVLPVIRRELNQSSTDASNPSLFASAPFIPLPFASLLMKILSDAKRLEDVRLVFAIMLREVAVPPVELFNVLLLSISWSDTFTDDEVDNIWRLLGERHVEPDAVTYACFLHLYLRLQRMDVVEAQWSNMVSSFRETISQHVADPSRNPLPVGLTTKLSHVFVVMIRVAPSTERVWELFDIIAPLTMRAVAYRNTQLRHLEAHLSSPPDSGIPPVSAALVLGDESLNASASVLTTKILVTFLSASLVNVGTSASQLRRLFSVLAAQYDVEHTVTRLREQLERSKNSLTNTPDPNMPATSNSEMLSNSVSTSTTAVSVARMSIFSSSGAISELNLFRLLGRCVQDGDVAFVDELIGYAHAHKIFSVPEHVACAELSAVGCMAVRLARTPSAGDIEALVAMLLRLEKTSLVAASSAELQRSLVVAMASASTESKTIQLVVSQRPIGGLIRKAFLRTGVSARAVVDALRSADKSGRPCTHVSLHRVLEFCAASPEGALALATELVCDGQMHSLFGVEPNHESWELLAQVAMRSPDGDVDSVWKVLDDMQRQRPPIVPRAGLLSSVLRYTNEIGDAEKSLEIIRLHLTHRVTLDRDAATQVVRQLCQLVDTEGVREVLRAWQSLNGSVDTRVTRMCAAVFQKYHLPHDDLSSFS